MPFLERLFPTTDFLRGCWPGRHAVAHGALGRLDPLGALPELADLGQLLRAYDDQVRVALPDKRDEHSSRLVDADEAERLHGEGLALIFNGVERFLPPVGGWLEGLRVELGLPRNCDPRSIVYVSPAGSGNSPHFDANANFVVQVRGKKRWRIAPNPDVLHPTDRWAMNQDALSEELAGYVKGPLPTQMPEGALTFDLVAGSVLFVPRGYWHETESDEDTLALNFTFGQPAWADLVLTALRRRLLEEPQWRALANGSDAPRVAQLLARLQAKTAELTVEEVADALDAEVTWLLVPAAFLRVDEGRVVASLGAGEFEIDADVSLHPVLEWIGRQRTPFSREQVALHFPAVAPGLPALLGTLTAQRLLGQHHGRPSPDRD